MASQYSDPYEEWKAQGRPGGSFEAWQASQGGGQAPQVSGGSVTSPAPTPTAGQSFADMIRAASTGQSEDFGRFSNAQVDAWQGAYDPLASALAGRPQFRSEGGGGALVDKPTECPPGTTLHGSNCVAYADLPSWAGGSYGMGDTGQRAGGTWAAGMAPTATSPLASVMSTVNASGKAAPTFRDPTNPLYGGIMGGQNLPATPTGTSSVVLGGKDSTPFNTAPMQTGTLQGIMAPLQGQGLGTGWQSGQAQNPLTGMLKKQQKAPQSQGWF